MLSSLSTEFIIFLPLNLLIFSCFWYLFYILFKNIVKIKHPYLFIYFISFIFYLIAFSLLYYYWLGFRNFSWMLFGFASYFMIVWIWKLVLFLTSVHVMEKMRKNNEKRFSFWNFVILFYVVLFVSIVFVVPMVREMVK